MVEAHESKVRVAPPKLKRSRNGCNECRRLHRRCDEEKPACRNCRDAEKACSYKKPLSWGGRPFKKSAFKKCFGDGVVEVVNADSSEDLSRSRSFVYGQLANNNDTDTSSSQSKVGSKVTSAQGSPKEPFSCSFPFQPGGTSFSSILLPWLSEHHRMLIHHFIDASLPLFGTSIIVQERIRPTLLPLLASTNHGFSLLAAVLSFASTHRMNLGLHQDVAEIEYWKDMGVGHLRRPIVQEDESTDNVFAATALVLCLRDVISDEDQPFSWKLHLQGAFTVLSRKSRNSTAEGASIRRILKRIAGGLQLRSPLPLPVWLPSPGSMDTKQGRFNSGMCGLPEELAEVLFDIRMLRLEKTALQNIQSSSGSSNMGPLWTSFQGQALQLIVRINALSHGVESQGGEYTTRSRLYCRVALLLVYSAVLDLSNTDAGLRSTIEAALTDLRSAELVSDTYFTAHLLFPLFTVGCLLYETSERALVSAMIDRIAQEQGKRNAVLAKAALEELWSKADAQDHVVKQADIDGLMVERGWDLSLW